MIPAATYDRDLENTKVTASEQGLGKVSRSRWQ